MLFWSNLKFSSLSFSKAWQIDGCRSCTGTIWLSRIIDWKVNSLQTLLCPKAMDSQSETTWSLLGLSIAWLPILPTLEVLSTFLQFLSSLYFSLCEPAFFFYSSISHLLLIRKSSLGIICVSLQARGEMT